MDWQEIIRDMANKGLVKLGQEKDSDKIVERFRATVFWKRFVSYDTAFDPLHLPLRVKELRN